MKSKIILLFLLLILPQTFANVGVINSDFEHIENQTKITNSLTQIDNINYRFEKFVEPNSTYELILPHDIKIIKNKSYGIKKIEYYEDFKKVISNSNQEVLIMYLEDKTPQKDYGNLILSIVIITVISSIIANTVIIKKIKHKYQTTTIIPEFVLSKEEKELYDCIKSNEGKNQKEIGKILNWSKARVSAISNNLNDKKLIRKERFGRVYRLYIINDVINGKPNK